MGAILWVWKKSKTFAIPPTIRWWQTSINLLRKFPSYIAWEDVLNTLSASGTGVPPPLLTPLLDLSLLEDWAPLSVYPFLIPLLVISMLSIILHDLISSRYFSIFRCQWPVCIILVNQRDRFDFSSQAVRDSFTSHDRLIICYCSFNNSLATRWTYLSSKWKSI